MKEKTAFILTSKYMLHLLKICKYAEEISHAYIWTSGIETMKGELYKS